MGNDCDILNFMLIITKISRKRWHSLLLEITRNIKIRVAKVKAVEKTTFKVTKRKAIYTCMKKGFLTSFSHSKPYMNFHLA